MTPLEQVQQAFQGLPVTVAFADPDADAPEDGEIDERWISISHDLVDHEQGIQACQATDEALATLVQKCPLPRDDARIARWLQRAP